VVAVGVFIVLGAQAYWNTTRLAASEHFALDTNQWVLPSADGDGTREPSIRDFADDHVLSNFVLTLEEDIAVEDDIESWRAFAGTLTTATGTSPFRVTAAEFSENAKLKAALFAPGGCELVIHGGMDDLRGAISTISKETRQVRRRKLTTRDDRRQQARNALDRLRRPLTPASCFVSALFLRRERLPGRGARLPRNRLRIIRKGGMREVEIPRGKVDHARRDHD
jgi:hypothetical protein